MTTAENLRKHMEYYDEYDVPFSGNPQITYFVHTNHKLQTRRHTNFAYGTIKINQEGNTIKTADNYVSNFIIKSPSFDMLNQISVCVKNLDYLSSILIEFDELKLQLDLDYIKIYNQIGTKIIHHVDTHSIITIPTNPDDFFYRTNSHGTLFNYLPNMHTLKELKVKVITNCDPDEIHVMASCVVIDTEEKKRCVQVFKYDDLKPINLIVKADSTGFFDLSFFNHKITSYTLGVKVKNFENLDNIQIQIGTKNIYLSKNILSIYNRMNKQIIFQDQDDHECKIIKISQIIDMDILTTKKILKIDNYGLKINYNNGHFENSNSVGFYNFFANKDLDEKLIGFWASSNICSYFREYSYEMYLKGPEQELTIDNFEQAHVKELFIYWTINGQEKRITKQIELTIQNKPEPEFKITNKYLELDCDIYQKMHHENFDPLVYNIGFALHPSDVNPTGELNVNNKLEIKWETKPEFIGSHAKMHVLVFGHKSIHYKTS